MRRSSLALAAAVLASVIAVAPAAGVPGQAPKRGGTVVIAAPEHFGPACLNPLVEDCSSDYLDLVLAGAYEVAPDATYRANLASGRVVAKTPFTVRYDIRPKARWSDGTPVTAKDFAFTHQAVLEYRPEFASPHLEAGLRRVVPLDPKTVKVVLKEPYVDWRELFPLVLPRHALAGQDLTQIWQGAIDDPRTGAPIGSGPFLVDRLEATRLVLRRNPRYWGPHHAYLDRIVIRFMAPERVAEAMRRGEADMIVPGPPIFQPPAQEIDRQRTPGITVVPGSGGSWEHIYVNVGTGGHSALEIPLVRQALAYGIDRVAIARAVLDLAGVRDAEPEPLDSALFLANSRYYRPNWKHYRYRPAKARQLLERAGCHRGTDGIYICRGERLTLGLLTARAERRVRTAELVQQHLRAVGVDVVLLFVHPANLGKAIEARDWDLFELGLNYGATTAWPLGVFGCQQPGNLSGWCDRLVTRDLDQATRIVNDARRVALLNRIDVRLAKAVPDIPLYEITVLFAYRANIRNVAPNGFTWNAEDWWLDD